MTDPEQDQWNARRKKTPPSKVVYDDGQYKVVEHFSAKPFLDWLEDEYPGARSITHDNLEQYVGN